MKTKKTENNGMLWLQEGIGKHFSKYKIAYVKSLMGKMQERWQTQITEIGIGNYSHQALPLEY